MNHCREYEDLLPLHAVGETGLDEAMAVEEHLGDCPACRAEVAALGELSESLRRELGEVPPVPDPWRADTDTPIGPAQVSVLRMAGWRGMALAASLLLAGVLVGRWSTPEQSGMTTPAPVLSTEGAVAPAVVATVLRRRPAFSVFSPVARRVLSAAAHGDEEAISPARKQP